MFRLVIIISIFIAGILFSADVQQYTYNPYGGYSSHPKHYWWSKHYDYPFGYSWGRHQWMKHSWHRQNRERQHKMRAPLTPPPSRT